VARLVQAMARLGLINTCHTCVQLVGSSGKRWFDRVAGTRDLPLTSATFDNGVLGLSCVPAAGGDPVPASRASFTGFLT
jgi:hypothetical protein